MFRSTILCSDDSPGILLAALFFACVGCGPSRDGNTFRFDDRGMTCCVEFRSERAVRILVRPDTARLVTRRLVTVPADAPVAVRCLSDKEGYLFRTSRLEVRYDRASGRFSFFDPASEQPLLEEDARTLVADIVGGEACLAIEQSFRTSPDESLYGLGQYQTGRVDHKRDTVLLLQANKEIANPFLVSSRGYGILWDNYSSSEFRDCGERFAFVSEVADAVDYWFVRGDSPADCVRGYRELHRGRIAAAQVGLRVLAVARALQVVRRARKRRAGVPQAAYSARRHRAGLGVLGRQAALEFAPVGFLRFPDPAARIARLHDSCGVRLMLSVWPGFGPRTEVYRELEQAGALFDERTWAGYKVFDAFDPPRVLFFWRHFSRGLLAAGSTVGGWTLPSPRSARDSPSGGRRSVPSRPDRPPGVLSTVISTCIRSCGCPTSTGG